MKRVWVGEAESAGNSALEQLGFSAAGEGLFSLWMCRSGEPALLSSVERSVFRPTRVLMGGLRDTRGSDPPSPTSRDSGNSEKRVLITTSK